ncbi:conserved Plasmodium protein, unknown function [Plasmodium relictum]|uniref:Uncharacterized protein n=1 Tax=Plasmodium relictum TaxID=85471 RepID=A0A1J1H6N3_PLARL|nr:conserved Plasmodium protein, unknown function [Plasmodium relictum]CRH00204.1 conserved Plasmodium protein, unknown function [Plasmodium relictum]
MENYFKKKVKDVFAILNKDNIKEKKLNLIENNKLNKYTKEKDKDVLNCFHNDNKKVNEDSNSYKQIIIKNDDKCLDQNNDKNSNKKRKLIKLHNKENVYLIDNYIKIKKNCDMNYANKKHLKKDSNTLNINSSNTPNICDFISNSKEQKEKKNKTLDDYMLNGKEKNLNIFEKKSNNEFNKKYGPTESIKKGKRYNLIDAKKNNMSEKIKNNTNDYEEYKEDEKDSTAKVDSNTRKKLKGMSEKKKSKKQKMNNKIINDKDNLNILKNNENDRKVNRIDEIFKSLIEKNEKKEKRYDNFNKSINTSIEKDSSDENKKDQIDNNDERSENNIIGKYDKEQEHNEKFNSNLSKNKLNKNQKTFDHTVNKYIVKHNNKIKGNELFDNNIYKISDEKINENDSCNHKSHKSNKENNTLNKSIRNEQNQHKLEYIKNGASNKEDITSSEELLDIKEDKNNEETNLNNDNNYNGYEIHDSDNNKIKSNDNHDNSNNKIMKNDLDEIHKYSPNKHNSNSNSHNYIKSPIKNNIKVKESNNKNDVSINANHVEEENDMKNLNFENSIKKNRNYDSETNKSVKKNDKMTNEIEMSDIKNENYMNDLRLKLPDFAIDQRKKLINETNEFFKRYNLNLKIEHLPINIPNDLKLLIQKKKKIVNIINDYKNEIKLKKENSKKEEKNIKLNNKNENGIPKEEIVDEEQTKSFNAKIETDINKNENKNDIEGINILENYSNTVNDINLNYYKSNDIKSDNISEIDKKRDYDINNCETVIDENELSFISEEKSNFINNEINYLHDNFEGENEKKNDKNPLKRKRKIEKKYEKNKCYDNLNYLSDSTKDVLEKEHKKFLNLFEKMNQNENNEDLKTEDISENKCNDNKDEINDKGENYIINNNTNDKVKNYTNDNVDNNTKNQKKNSKSTFIHNLINDLTANNNEEENYIKYKKIKNEELRYKKLKEVITEIKIKEKKIDVILSSSLNFFKYSNIYRHRHFLHEKMLINWSYVENLINKKNDIRNRNLPFQLLELDKRLLENIQNSYDDILLDDFSGIIITLNTNSFATAVDGNSIHISKIICGCLIEYLNTSELNIKSIWAHPFLSAKSTYYILCAFLPRVILEAFLNNNICSENKIVYNELMNPSNHKEHVIQKNVINEIKEIDKQKKKKKISFYDKLDQIQDYNKNPEDDYFSNFAAYQYPSTFFLNFNKKCASLLNSSSNDVSNIHDDTNKITNDIKEINGDNIYRNSKKNNEVNENKDNNKNSYKFLYIIFSDIDIFPRQCYLLLCSYKYMCLNMHYDTDNYFIHYDINLKNIQKENIGKTTELSNNCPCTSIKNCESILEESCERIIGCSELYMYYMIPKKEERESLGLLKRRGWRDLISNTFYEDIKENISSIIKIRTNINNLYDHISMQNKIYEKHYTSSYINKYEWCGLKLKDIRNMINEDFNFESPKKK